MDRCSPTLVNAVLCVKDCGMCTLVHVNTAMHVCDGGRYNPGTVKAVINQTVIQVSN